MRTKRTSHLARVCALLVVVSGVVLASRPSVAQTEPSCSPACATGETCVNGVCMVPAHAAPAPAVPAPAAPSVAPPPTEAAPPPPAAAPTPAAPTVAEPYRTLQVPDAAAPPQYVPPPAPASTWHEGLMAMPFLGFNSFAGDTGRNTDIGFRLGGFLGARSSENWSENGELTFDVVNLNTPSGISASEYMIEAALAPLFHVPIDKVELVLGPIIGVWYLSGSASEPGVATADSWAWGWSVGGNLGILFPVNDKARLGVLVSFAPRTPIKFCISGTANGTAVPEQCQSDGLSAAKPFGFTLAAMF